MSMKAKEHLPETREELIEMMAKGFSHGFACGVPPFFEPTLMRLQ